MNADLVRAFNLSKKSVRAITPNPSEFYLVKASPFREGEEVSFLYHR